MTDSYTHPTQPAQKAGESVHELAKGLAIDAGIQTPDGYLSDAKTREPWNASTDEHRSSGAADNGRGNMTEAHQIDRPLAVGSHEGLAGCRTERVGCCTLYLADYRDVLPTLQGVTAIVTDPPYGNDYRQKRSRDKLVKPDTTHAPIVGNAEPFDPRPLLQAAPVVVLWGANYYADKLPANGKWLVWDKREGTTPDDGADVELAWTNLRGVPRMHRQLWRGICRRGEENVSRGAKKLHPNQKPVALMDWCLQQAGVGADALVVDTHMGSGTTALACLRRGVRFVGMEIDPMHFATTVERLRKELPACHEPANA